MDTKIVAMIRNGRGATQRKVWNKFQRHSSVLSFLCLFDKWILYSNWLILISCQYCYNQCMSNICIVPQLYCRQERKSRDRKLSRSIKRIRADMVEISKGHKRIKEGQEEVRGRFEEISKEAAKLKEETNLISKQSAANQVRLNLMFQIVKARSENDTARDAVLTQTLRFVILQIFGPSSV